MFKMIKTAFSYMCFYKMQTFVILLGMILSATLISGIGSLMYSGQMADLKNAREQYGDWHYKYVSSSVDINKKDILSKCALLYQVKSEDDIRFCYANDDYLDVMGHRITEGYYPDKKGEIALDQHTLNNLGADRRIGSVITVGGEEYVISGIMTDGCDSNEMKIFVSSDEKSVDDNCTVYLKFDETGSLEKKLKTFARGHGLDLDEFEENDEVTEHLSGRSRESVITIAKAAFTNPDAGLVYFIGQLNLNYGLVGKTVFFSLILFGVFIIYSLFDVTVVRRRSQYAVLQVIGLEEKHIFTIMLTELLTIAVVGFPVGSLTGNLVAKMIYSDVGMIFSSRSEGSRFYVSEDSIICGAILMLAFIVLIAFRMIVQMRKSSGAQMIRSARKYSRKIFSRRRRDLTGVMTKRFMFGDPKTFIGMIVSLSLGGIIFLGTAYTADCSLRDSQHKSAIDRSLKSDINVYIDSTEGYEISADAADRIGKINGVRSMSRTSYLLGEVPLDNGKLLWTEFYSNNSKGIIKKVSGDSYRIKVNVYGYDDNMIESLSDYLLDGDIVSGSDNVILKVLTDGQGNTGGMDLAVGDTITLKVPKTMADSDLLEFDGNDDDYTVKEFRIAAIVNRPIEKNENYIGDNGTDVVDIIMSNDQMKDSFGVNGFCNVAVDLNEGVDHEVVVNEISQVISGLKHCSVKDNSNSIEQQMEELHRKERFFYGIAIILLCISLLHVINSMRYIIISKRGEFGIVRAMGIGDGKFIRMLLFEGVRYGIYTSLFMVVMYLIVHRILNFVMKKVFLYVVISGDLMIGNCLIMLAVNIVLCIFAVILAGRELLKENIIAQVKV